MNRKTLYQLGMLLFSALVIIARPSRAGERFHMRTKFTYGSPAETAPERAERRRGPSLQGNEQGTGGYIVRFPLLRFPAGSINCYAPKYAPADQKTARFYAELFGMPPEYGEDDEAYIFNSGEGSLTIYKHAKQLRYEAAPARDENTDDVLNADFDTDLRADSNIDSNKESIEAAEAVKLADEFLTARIPAFTYEEAAAVYGGGRFTVTFTDRIGNLKNYAFNNAVTLDARGRVLQADYFYIQYERLGSCKIISMRDAYKHLPSGPPFPISLEYCELVYSYENSIVQPSYRFAGKTPGGGAFEYFVKAAVY